MNNKTLGNNFEQELCERLSEYGFWCHNMAMNKSGQPADIIAVRNKVAYLIDAKVCSSRGFALSRVEENQELSMQAWRRTGNGYGWFAIKFKDDNSIDETVMFSMADLKFIRDGMKRSRITRNDATFRLREWVTLCELV